MFGIGIIGCGKIAQVRHLPEFLAHPEAKVVALYDRTYERAKALADPIGARTYATIDELLSDKEIDAVVVCVANCAHCEVTIKALKAGKHVLCEKPMATTLKECELMVKTAEECGKKLFIGQNQRFAKAHIRAKEMIENGDIGDVITFRTVFGHCGPENWSINPGKGTWFFDRNQAAIGVMADLGIHKIDLIQYLIGQRVTAVTSRMLTLNKTFEDGTPITVDDNSFCIYEMSGGAAGTMTASWTYYACEDNSTVIFGTKGTLRIYDYNSFPIEMCNNQGEKTVIDVDQIQTNDNQTTSGIADSFMSCLINDDEPSISGKDVLAAMRAVFAGIESSEKNCRIEIPENA